MKYFIFFPYFSQNRFPPNPKIPPLFFSPFYFFPNQGYSLKTDGLDEILSFVNRFQDAEDEAIDLLLDQLDHQSLKSFIIDKEAVHQVFMVGQLSIIQSLVGERGRRWVSSPSWRKFEILVQILGLCNCLRFSRPSICYYRY
uniref:Uncharacterized protein n=1 Tax=Gossypium raimondii TaxID=29730 RepID=A0A0D2V0E5_GOSRA|nr:hypothetical protein B456_009G404500 [Gossypium raimondii]